jgi:hypothetical protein
MNVISFCSSGLIVTVMSGLANPTAATSWPSGGVWSAASGLLSRSCLKEKKGRSPFLSPVINGHITQFAMHFCQIVNFTI